MIRCVDQPKCIIYINCASNVLMQNLNLVYILKNDEREDTFRLKFLSEHRDEQRS